MLKRMGEILAHVLCLCDVLLHAIRVHLFDLCHQCPTIAARFQ